MEEEAEGKRAFLFYESYYRAADEMSVKDKAAFVLALCAYIFDGTEPELKGTAKVAWLLTKPVIDSDVNRRKNGKKGGRPKAKKQNHGFENSESMVSENEKPHPIYDKGQGIKDKGQGIKDNNGARAHVEPTASVSLLSEIESFCLAHGGTPADAAVFYAQYDKAGWKAGGQPIENWPGLCMGFLRNGGAKAVKSVTAFDTAAAEKERKRNEEIRRNGDRLAKLLAEEEERDRLEAEQKQRELAEASQ